MSESTPKSKKRPSGMMVQFLVSVVAVLLGVLLLFVPGMQTVTLCYIFCAALILLGVVLAIRFIIGESERRMHNYLFSAGVMLIILGICGLINAVKIADSLDLYMGVLTLILGSLMLENAVRLLAGKNVLWIPALVLAALAFLGAIPVLAGIRAILDAAPTYPYWVLFIVGILNLASLALAWFGMKAIRKNAEKAAAEARPAPPQEP